MDLAQGVHTFQVRARDAAGNVDPTPATYTWTVTRMPVMDTTPPTVGCSATPNMLWPPNNRLVAVTVALTASDPGTTDAVTVTLVSVTSNESGTADDIQGWVIGTDDRGGQLRAERAGGGNGRVYTLTYRATDIAGNSANGTCTVTVPHDRGR
jgi:hypothetical protein